MTQCPKEDFWTPLCLALQSKLLATDDWKLFFSGSVSFWRCGAPPSSGPHLHNVGSHIPLLFHLIHWGTGFQSNPELTDKASADFSSSAFPFWAGITGGLPRPPGIDTDAGNPNLNPQAWTSSALTKESSPQPVVANFMQGTGGRFFFISVVCKF